jgi:hypothetical protein
VFHTVATAVVALAMVLGTAAAAQAAATHPARALANPCPGGQYPGTPGQRVKAPNNPAVYLIDPDGRRRWIPTGTAYEKLFRDWAGIIVDPYVGCIFKGATLTDNGYDAELVKGDQAPDVYISVDGWLRAIPSEEVFNRYHFAWNKIIVVPPGAGRLCVDDSFRCADDFRHA